MKINSATAATGAVDQGFCLKMKFGASASALFYFMLKNEIYGFFFLLKVGHIVGKNVNNTIYLNTWKYIKGISVLANLVILITVGKII